MIQDDYRRLYCKVNSNWKDSISIYKELVRKNIKKNSVVLEAGCGFSSMFKDEYRKAKRVIGVDVNEDFLQMNDVLDEKIVANLESIPQIKNSSVDLIISSWVFEHFRKPENVFCEFSRVLKKGGKVIFLTPNNLNYVVILNRLVPESLRKSIVGKMSKDLVTDPMPAFYKANSVKKLKELAKTNDLSFSRIILNGDPTYIAINKLFFKIGVFIEKIQDISLFRKFRVHIIGIMKKN